MFRPWFGRVSVVSWFLDGVSSFVGRFSICTWLAQEWKKLAQFPEASQLSCQPKADYDLVVGERMLTHNAARKEVIEARGSAPRCGSALGGGGRPRTGRLECQLAVRQMFATVD